LANKDPDSFSRSQAFFLIKYDILSLRIGADLNG
jgi:hypothetical protein